MKKVFFTIGLITLPLLGYSQDEISISNNNYHLYGPNSAWGQYLQVGGNGRVTTNASVVATNGNLHLDSKDGSFRTYINHYSQGRTILNTNGGFVGIGTANPAYKLDIYGNNNPVSLRLLGGTNNSNAATFNIGVVNGRDWEMVANAYNSSDGYSLNFNHKTADYQGAVTYSWNGNEKFRIDPNGDIKLNGGTQNFKLSNLNGSETGYGDFISHGGIAINGDDGNNRQMFLFTDGTANSNIFTIASSTDAGSNWNPGFVVKQNGSVGIGTTNLDSNFKLSVNGSIRSKEVKVEASWSDFVFYDNYELRTLEEVEQHINDKGHLPEIPSEAEVTENGINLGEMDAKLLQKIEELTLYLIEQNKELKTANQRIGQLEQKISQLENE